MESRGLNLALWFTQITNSAVYVGSGVWKLTTPVGELAAIIPWAGDVPYSFLVFIGVVDIVGGIGTVLPSLVRVKPGTTVVAALGCAVLQMSAIVFHVGRGEVTNTPGNVVFFAMAVFIAWGRWRGAPVQGR